MSYATLSQWSAKFKYLGQQLDDGVEQTALDTASSQINTLIHRRSLEPKTVTDHCWPATTTYRNYGTTSTNTGSATSRVVFLPDYPPRYPELWSQTITGLEVLDSFGLIRQTIDVANIVEQPELEGRIVLPQGNYVGDLDIMRASYSCGYSPIPNELIDACICLAQSNIFNTLGVQNPADSGRYYGKSDTMVQVESLICTFRRLAVA